MAARIPAQPAPITSTSCFASTLFDATRKARGDAALRGVRSGRTRRSDAALDLLAARALALECLPKDIPEALLVLLEPRPFLRRPLLIALLRHRLLPRADLGSPRCSH